MRKFLIVSLTVLLATLSYLPAAIAEETGAISTKANKTGEIKLRQAAKARKNEQKWIKIQERQAKYLDRADKRQAEFEQRRERVKAKIDQRKAKMDVLTDERAQKIEKKHLQRKQTLDQRKPDLAQEPQTNQK
ncbi:hypothetical protein [Vibrio owensii]|uniref:hypothetical protein n=1 Tax=Vibrio owensii TaxID=696485 RepID=UPI0018F18203|nr:hypothetical protein [Vibrio owensii]